MFVFVAVATELCWSRMTDVLVVETGRRVELGPSTNAYLRGDPNISATSPLPVLHFHCLGFVLERWWYRHADW